MQVHGLAAVAVLAAPDVLVDRLAVERGAGVAGEKQQQVIDSRNRNLLVSAAAGSGKTAVLVERIVKKITGENQTDIDRLVVVTFTRAAAAEMKARIRNRLDDMLEACGVEKCKLCTYCWDGKE